MSQVILAVNIKIKEEFLKEVSEDIKNLHKLTHQLDRGCFQYDLHKVKGEDNHYFLFERWENQLLLDEHMNKEHFIKFQERNENKIEAVEINFLDKYEG